MTSRELPFHLIPILRHVACRGLPSQSDHYIRAWNSLGVRLATNLDALLQKEDDVFRDEGIIDHRGDRGRERERVGVVHEQKGQVSLGRLMTARRMEEGTEPDMGTTVSGLGVREFSWVNFIRRPECFLLPSPWQMGPPTPPQI